MDRYLACRDAGGTPKACCAGVGGMYLIGDLGGGVIAEHCVFPSRPTQPHNRTPRGWTISILKSDEKSQANENGLTLVTETSSGLV